MTTRRLGGALIVLVVWGAGASGQVPAVPGAAPAAAVPGAPALPGAAAAPAAAGAGGFGAAGAAGAAPAAAAPQKNIWGFFMMTPEQKLAHQKNSEICKAKFCASRIGQFVNNMLLPAGAVTGGLLGPICPGPNAANPADLAKPATSPEGAAARIKAEEAQVKAKIAAIEFLATVDCHYYPEAEAALIVGLRAEKNECVRLAAARALATGCCCTAKIVKALTIAVNGSKEDKFPAERSELVKTYAYVALERCMLKCVEGDPEPPPEPPAAAKQAVYETLAPFGPTADYATAILLATYFTTGGGEPADRVYAKARLALGKGLHISADTLARLSGPKTVMDAVTPGFDLPRPGKLFEQVSARSASGPSWIKTLPRSDAPEPVAVVPAGGAAPDRREFVVQAAGPVEPGKPVLVKTLAAPQPDPAANPEPPPAPRTGRGNLLNIFQDARRR